MENNRTHNAEPHLNQESKAKILGRASSFEAWLIPLFAQTPHIPQGAKKVITDILPRITVVFGVLGIVGLLGLGNFGMWVSPFMIFGGAINSFSLLITAVLGITCSILALVSFRPLLAMQKKSGWDYAFYALTINGISTILHLFFLHGGIGGILAVIFGGYILFEIRDLYH